MYKLSFLDRNFSLLPEQRSDKWFENRKHTFGGSEIGALVGDSKFRSSRDVLSSKIRPQRHSNVNFWFGNLFEPVAKQVVEHEYSKVHEFGAIPASNVPICYSPDGVFVWKDDLRLLEIKCPIMRTIGGPTPKEYAWQVQTGLMIIPAANALYIEFQFRKCGMKYFNSKYCYDQWFHRARTVDKDANYLVRGFYWWPNPLLVDLGAKSRVQIEEIIPLLRKGTFQFVGENVVWPTTGYILPFKLFGVHKAWIEPDLVAHEQLKSYAWKNYCRLEELRNQPPIPPEVFELDLPGFDMNLARYKDNIIYLVRNKTSQCPVHKKAHRKFCAKLYCERYSKEEDLSEPTINLTPQWYYVCMQGGKPVLCPKKLKAIEESGSERSSEI